MTHRFKHILVDSTAGPVPRCGEKFGGVAECALPYESPEHYQNHHHPMTGGGLKCTWVLQTLFGRDTKIACEENAENYRHDLSKVTDWRSRPGTIRPPDEDEVGRAANAEPGVVGGNFVFEQVPKNVTVTYGAGSSTRGQVRAAVEEEDQPLEAWQMAAEAIDGYGVVVAGPWPVRQYRIEGAETHVAGGDRPWMRVIASLLTTAQDFTLQVWTVPGDTARVVRVTWGHLDGLGDDVLADEIVARYGS